MPLDAICLAAVREELSERIVGMKIDKVQQPERDIIILTLRGMGASCRLLISAGSGGARIHLTEHQFENPASPPMFCMLLRKHLIGARILSITQPPAERVLEIKLLATDILGDLSEKQLVIELIGQISNIILTGNDTIIIDCLRRIGGEFTDKRSVLPGLLYCTPSVQEGKLDPLKTTLDEWQSAYQLSIETTVDKWLLSKFFALSPMICRELSWRAYGETDFPISEIKDDGAALHSEFFKLVFAANMEGFEPWTIADADGVPIDFSYTRIMQYDGALNVVREKSFSAMLDTFYTQKAKIERLRQRASVITKTVKTARDRIIRKLTAQREELKKTEERETLRENGDIITANMHIMKKGESVLTAQDFFREDGVVRRIILDMHKTPQQNAARYYKEYTKAKTAQKYLKEQIRLAESELSYLESVLDEIELAENGSDVLSIRDELVRTGYLKAQKNEKNAKSNNAESTLRQFKSSTGLRILAGRNNTQNDQLTLKIASKSDIWLHTQKIHGAHVIIICGGEIPDDTTMYEAAVIAAYYSSARAGGKVAVDYTFVKHVKKPPGSRPGMVTYTDYKTIIVTPDEKLVTQLQQS